MMEKERAVFTCLINWRYMSGARGARGACGARQPNTNQSKLHSTLSGVRQTNTNKITQRSVTMIQAGNDHDLLHSVGKDYSIGIT